MYKQVLFKLSLLLFTLPFWVSDAFVNMATTPKTFFFLFYAASLLILVSLNLLRSSRTQTFSFSWADLSLGTFVLYTLAGTLFYQDVHITDHYFLSLILLFGLYLYYKHFGQKEFHRFTWVMLLAGTTQAVWGISQYAGILPSLHTHFEVTGSFENPGPYAVYLASLFPIALGTLLFQNSNRPLKLLCLVFLVTGLFSVLISNSRASWVGIVVGCMVLLAYKYRRPAKRIDPRLRIAAVIFLAIVTAAGGVLLFQYKADSAHGRLFIWKNCLTLFTKSPFVGHGPGRYAPAYNDAQAAYFRDHPADVDNARLAENREYAFNDYLQLLVESGVVGLILFLMPVFLIVRNLVRDAGKSTIAVISMGELVSILVMAFVSYPFRNLPVMLHYFVLLAFMSPGNGEKVLKVSLHKKYLGPMTFIFILLLTGLIGFTYVRYEAQKQWKKALTWMASGNTAPALDLYRKSYVRMEYDKYFLYNYGAELSRLGLFRESIPVLEAARKKLNDSDTYLYLGNSYEGIEDFDKAEECFLKASWLMPVKFYPEYRLVQLYDCLGEKEKALSVARRILKKPDKVDSDIVRQIKWEMTNYVNAN